jgi:hypothetical protein
MWAPSTPDTSTGFRRTHASGPSSLTDHQGFSGSPARWTPSQQPALRLGLATETWRDGEPSPAGGGWSGAATLRPTGPVISPVPHARAGHAPRVTDDWADFLLALLDAGARFLVVGAHALAVHGVPRGTQDLDVWVDLNRTTFVANKRATGRLKDLGDLEALGER